jgi:adenylylsulfate kinase
MAGGVLWITGRPACGKSTLARALVDALTARGRRATLIDSDEVREAITPEPTYSPEERGLFYRALAYLAARLAREGIIAVVAATAHEAAYRRWASEICPGWFLIYARCPREVCEARDPKGLYARARRDPCNTLPGVGVPYEEPADADLVVETDRTIGEEELRKIVSTFLTHLDAND